MLASSVEIRGSDHLRELVERCGEDESRTCIDTKFVVPSPQVLDECVASDHDSGSPVQFEAPHRTKSCLEAPMVSFDSVVAYWVVS